MNDAEMQQYLRENGYPEHVVKAGRKGLIERWNKFVDEVERGYGFGIEDYRNDLDLRGILSMIGAGDEVEEADARLQKMLVGKEHRVWESGVEDAWWDYGYPKNAKGELAADLGEEGFR
jgi:hypothetical protein